MSDYISSFVRIAYIICNHPVYRWWFKSTIRHLLWWKPSEEGTSIIPSDTLYTKFVSNWRLNNVYCSSRL